MTRYFTAHGASAYNAREMAFAWIGQAVAKQSTLLAYIDVFWIAGAFARHPWSR